METAIGIVLYFVYVVGIIAFIFIVDWFYARIKEMDYTYRTIKHLIENGYEHDKIDLNTIYKRNNNKKK